MARDYQTKINKGGLPDSLVNTKFGAGEFNSIAQEVENLVTRSGQALAPSDGTGEVSTQMAESAFLNGVKAQHFQDGGSVNTIELTPVSGASGVKVPTSYANMDGAHITFFASNSNTGATTINLGQTAGSLIGAKSIVREDGSALSSGDIDTIVENEILFDLSNDRWVLVRGAGVADGDVIGPASSIDTGIPVFNGTSGKILKGTTATIIADGSLVLKKDIYLNFAPNNNLFFGYDGTTGTIGPNNSGGSTTLELGTSLSGVYSQKLSIAPDGTVTFGGLSYPTSDGTSGQALVTNGSGVLSFADLGVTLKGTRTTTGTWTVTGLISGKPLFITINAGAVAESFLQFKVTSGTSGNGQATTAGQYFVIGSSSNLVNGDPCGTHVIPNATSVEFNVNTLTAGATVEAWQ